MPSIDEHYAKYLHNKKLLGLDDFRDVFADWFITVLFYGALHLVEHELAKHGLHSEHHTDRRKKVYNEPSLKKVHTEYKSLYDMSLDTRYDCINLTVQDIEEAEKWFDKIEAHLSTNA